MFKKLLKAVLPALLVFSFANVNDAKVEAANKKNQRKSWLPWRRDKQKISRKCKIIRRWERICDNLSTSKLS